MGFRKFNKLRPIANIIMKLTEYLLNKDNDMPSSVEDKKQYHKYYATESVIGVGLGLGIALGYGALVIPVSVVLADMGVRLRRDAYRTTPTSGLVGLIKEYVTK